MTVLKFKERLQKPKDEKGGGLLNLIAISTIVGAVTLTITAGAYFGTVVTHESLAKQQAEDSANSGISEVFANFTKGTCSETGSDPDLGYSYTIYHSSESTVPTSIDSIGLSPGCPTDLDKWALVYSEGVGKNDTKRSSIATFKWNSADEAIVPQLITGKLVNLNSVEILGSASGVQGLPNIYSKDGGVSCNDPIEKPAKKMNVKLVNPSVVMDCDIQGNVQSSSDVDFGFSEIKGDVCSAEFIFNGNGIAGRAVENSVDCYPAGSFYGYQPDYSSNTINITADACVNFTRFKQIVEAEYDDPTILNATSCGADINNMLSTTVPKTLTLDSVELTIVTESDTQVSDLTVETANGSSSLNFVIPSGISSSDVSTCSVAASINLQRINYEDGVTGIFYSPCSVTMKESDISGQVYGGESVTIEDTSISFYPVNLYNTDKIFGDGTLGKNLVRVF